MQEYVSKGYIREVDGIDAPGWYLPHFAVLREDRDTTKLRVVFDSAATFLGVCVNDVMYTGPKLQSDIIDILTRFRSHPVVFVGDIKEMFSQIALQPKDRRFQRILRWDMDRCSPVETYDAYRLPFGDRASPFLAHFVVRRHAEDNAAASFPVSAHRLPEDIT